MKGAAWALQIDGPGSDQIDALVADDQSVTLLGRYEYEIDLGGGMLGAPPEDEEFEFSFFLGKFSSKGEHQWSSYLGGAAPGKAVMAPSSRGGVLALLPLSQIEGPPQLERVHALAGKLKRSWIKAGATLLGEAVAVSDTMAVALSHSEDELEEALFLSGDASQTLLAKTRKVDYASQSGLYLAGSFWEPWKFGSKKFKVGDCDEDNPECLDAFILALSPQGKLRWGLQLGREYRDDEVGPIASHPQGGVAVRVMMDEEDEYQIGAKKVALDANTLLKLTHEGEVQWSATPSNGIRDMIVRPSGEVYAIGLRSKHQYVEGRRVWMSYVVLSHFDKAGNSTVQEFGDPMIRKGSPRIAMSPNGKIYLSWTRAHEKGPPDSVLVLVEEKAKP